MKTSFAVDVGTVPASELESIAALAGKAEWRPIREYFTAEVTGSFPECQRAFFIKIPPKAQIYRHTDSVYETTHHIVVQTNPGCVNGWSDEDGDHEMHLEQGRRYLVDRFCEHWAKNAGDTDRIHLLLEY